MTELNDLMTIKEFAAASGRSPQTLYKQLSTRLAAFLREIDGQKYIERRALVEVFGIGDEQPVQPQENNFCAKVDNAEQPLHTILKAELEAKNQQIARLMGELEAERQHSRELADKLAQLADQAQRLHAGTIQQMLPEGGSEEQLDTSEPETAATVEPVEAAPEPSEPVRNGGFWKWVKSLLK